MFKVDKCYLKNVGNDNIIPLPNGKEVIIGRNKDFLISDINVSRNQVSCIANFEKYEVKVKWLGANMSGINGYALKKDIIYNITHSDRLEVLFSKLIYEVIFKPPPPESDCGADVAAVNGKRKQNTKETHIASIFNTAKARCSEFEWERVDNGKLHVMKSRGIESRSKVAAYDLDGTIIKTQSGLVFPKDTNDWKIAFTEIPKKLKQLEKDGYKIVFFTNQANIGSGKIILKDFKRKLENIVSKLGVDVHAFVSTERSIYRKPAIGMWEEFLKRNGDSPVNNSQSFYCGDAAGRLANWAPKMKKDHSSADRLFALNIGLKFLTPEEHFLDQKPVEYSEPAFDPRKIIDKSLTEPQNIDLISKNQEMLILVGWQGSGKSFISKEYLQKAGYKWVNRDTLKTATNCIREVEDAVKNRQSVVIDNTNVDVQARKQYIDIAIKYKIPVRCGVMNTSLEQSFHNNLYRELTDSSHSKIPVQLIYSFKNKLELPTKEEGFSEIFKINCIPKFNNDSEKCLYTKFLLDK